MATPSIVMLSDISMERLYLSQPPGWNDLQRLPFSNNQTTSVQGPDGRSSQQTIRSCYDKLLHHIYDLGSPLTSSTTTNLNQIKEQLKLAAEYCRLKTFEDSENIYLDSDRFFLQVKFDSTTRSPIGVLLCITNESTNHEEPIPCNRMLRALNEKQYRLFRKHLCGFANMFTIVAPTMNNDKRIGYSAYKILQQDLERLTKTTIYSKVLQGFQAMCEGLPMRIQLNDRSEINPSLPSHVQIVLSSSSNQHHLPIKSIIHIDEITNQILFDASNFKSTVIGMGHFILEIDEDQPPFTLLQTYAQEISRITNFNQLVSNTKTFNYLASLMPKSKYISRYQWYISHDQQAISIRQIPFTNVKQLLDILNFLRQQVYLTKYLHYYLNVDEEQEMMEDEMNVDQREIYLELSFVSTTLLSITSAQSSNLSTFLLNLSNIEALPWLSYRQQQKDAVLTQERNSLLKKIEQLLREESYHGNSSPIITMESSSIFSQHFDKSSSKIEIPAKLNRRLSCGPPAKASWRSATSLRRTQAACLTILSKVNQEETVENDLPLDDENLTKMNTDDSNDDDIFLSDAQSDGNLQNPSQQQGLTRAALSLNPASLSRCTSVSSTQSASTPTLFGLTPSTPYPGGNGNSNGNIFFPLAKQVSVPDYNPPSPSFSLTSLNPSVFLSVNAPTNSNSSPSATDLNNQNQLKKKRPRPDHSADDLMSPMGNNPNGTKMVTPTTDQSTVKRPKKPSDKTAQAASGQQIVRQKSAFKVADSPTASIVTQASTSPDEVPSDFKPLKVVIKRVGDGANSSTDELQQGSKPRKKQVTQPMNNFAGNNPSGGKKSLVNQPPGATSPSTLVKSESFELSQFNLDNGNNQLMNASDPGQQNQKDRQRPSSSLSNSSSSSSSPLMASHGRTSQQQPPIVLKIQRSKVYPGQDQTTTSSTNATTPTQTNVSTVAPTKEPNKSRPRASTSGPALPKQSVTSPTNLTTKLTSPSPNPTGNPLAPANTLAPSFRIPKKPSAQDVTVKPKIEPGTTITNPNTNAQKTTLLPAQNTPNDPSKSMNKLTSPNNVRPTPPASQIGSWQSPPTQQPSRFHQNRPRQSWSQQQQQQQQPVPGLRGRVPSTSPNVASISTVHPSFSQQPRSILKKPSANELPGSDSLYMSSSELTNFNEQRIGVNYSQASSSFLSRTGTPTDMVDDNDDDASPQAQLVIDTGSNATNQMNLPYTIVPGSNTTSAMESFDSSHDGHAMNVTSQHHQQANLYRDEQSS